MNETMEQKEIKIVPPEGYEFDTENSTFECIKFKKVEKEDITLEDIHKKVTPIMHNGAYCFMHASPRYQKVAAYSLLMEIAEYYNQGWKPDWDNEGEFKCFIAYHNEDNTYRTESNVKINRGEIYFKDEVDAQSVIDNPNFREILDVLFKN